MARLDFQDMGKLHFKSWSKNQKRTKATTDSRVEEKKKYNRSKEEGKFNGIEL